MKYLPDLKQDTHYMFMLKGIERNFIGRNFNDSRGVVRVELFIRYPGEKTKIENCYATAFYPLDSFIALHEYNGPIMGYDREDTHPTEAEKTRRKAQEAILKMSEKLIDDMDEGEEWKK